MEWLQRENLPILLAIVPSLALWVWMGISTRSAGPSRPARPWPRWRFGDAAMLMLLVMVAPLGVTVLLGTGGSQGNADAATIHPLRLALISLAQAASALAVLWAFRPLCREPLTTSDPAITSEATAGPADAVPTSAASKTSGPRRELIGTAVAWGWAALAPCFLVNGLIILAGLKDPHAIHPLLKMLTESSESQFVVVLAVCIAAGVCAPIAEEIQFRYALQGWISSAWGSAAGLWISSLIFAGIHARMDALPLIPLSLMLGTLYARRRSLVANMLCHATFNLLNIAIAVTQHGLVERG